MRYQGTSKNKKNEHESPATGERGSSSVFDAGNIGALRVSAQPLSPSRIDQPFRLDLSSREMRILHRGGAALYLCRCISAARVRFAAFARSYIYNNAVYA